MQVDQCNNSFVRNANLIDTTILAISFFLSFHTDPTLKERRPWILRLSICIKNIGRVLFNYSFIICFLSGQIWLRAMRKCSPWTFLPVMFSFFTAAGLWVVWVSKLVWSLCSFTGLMVYLVSRLHTMHCHLMYGYCEVDSVWCVTL